MNPLIRSSPTGSKVRSEQEQVRLLLVVEGIHDVAFLKQISTVLRVCDRSLPNLASMESQGQVVFLPFGGGDILSWAERLAPLRRPEFHLYDREQSPETDVRRTAIDRVNRRANCRGALTTKRSLENYLHPLAIHAASGIEMEIDDFCPVAELAARRLYEASPRCDPWDSLSQRARKRMANRAKKWLNTRAIEQMTTDLLVQRNALEEVSFWLNTIHQLASS